MTSSSRYRVVADALRDRIQTGAYPVGTKLPSIVNLQREFDVPGLNTIRDAQQILVREGLLRTEQGVGAWVIAQQSVAADRESVLRTLRQSRDALDHAICALEDLEAGGQS